jgi:hypothetical protein
MPIVARHRPGHRHPRSPRARGPKFTCSICRSQYEGSGACPNCGWW